MANKKISRRNRESTRELLAAERKAHQRAARAARTPQDVASEIHRLECFIAAAPRLARQKKLARLNYVPPPEQDRAIRATDRLPLHRARAINLERATLLIKIGVTLALIGGVLGWLNQTWHFLR